MSSRPKPEIHLTTSNAIKPGKPKPSRPNPHSVEIVFSKILTEHFHPANLKSAKCIEAVCKGYAQEVKPNVKNVALASIQTPATVRTNPNNQPAPAYPFRYITYSVFKKPAVSCRFRLLPATAAAFRFDVVRCGGGAFKAGSAGCQTLF